MGFSTSVIKYFSLDGTPQNYPVLEGHHLCGRKVAISAQGIAVRGENIDPVFGQKKITLASFASGYRPLFLAQSGLKNAIAALGDSIVSIRGIDVPVSRQGAMLIPEELLPLKRQFQQAAGYFLGLTGAVLNPEVCIRLDLRREIVALPGIPGGQNSSIPHCDYSDYKTPYHNHPPQVFVMTADPVGTEFYPATSFLDITNFTQRGAKTRLSSSEDHAEILSASAGRWVAATDLHVHGAPLVKPEDVPESEQLLWKEYDDETGKLVRQGRACFRSFCHMAFERS